MADVGISAMNGFLEMVPMRGVVAKMAEEVL